MKISNFLKTQILILGIVGTGFLQTQFAYAQDDHGHDHEHEAEPTTVDHSNKDGHGHEHADESDGHDHGGSAESEGEHDHAHENDEHNHAETGDGSHEDDGHDHGHDDEHGEHDESLKLSDAVMKELNISLKVAGPGALEFHASFPGEVRLNEDRLAHVVPNIAGVAKSVVAHLGDTVDEGDVMAVLASRELAEAQAQHLASHAELELLEVTYKREKQLWEDNISPEQDYLQARNAVEKGRIALRASEQHLYALGLSRDDIHKSGNESNSELTRFEIRAPIAGTVIEKHITLGEALDTNTPIFGVADLSTVWVDLSIYAKDLLSVRKGQKVILSSDTALPDTEGTISYIGPVIGEETRTAMARVILPTADHMWRPGMFVSAKVSVDELQVGVMVPKTALQTIDGVTKIFVQDDDGFEAIEVKLGRVDEHGAEILAGLKAGQTYVASGGFYLKAELAKEAFAGDGHNH